MGLFQKKKQFEMTFKSRSEAFNSMLAYLIEDKNMEPLEAAQQANEFAEIFATNMGIPANIEPPKQGVDKYICEVKKVITTVKETPELIEYGIPFVSFLVGLFTEKKLTSNNNMNSTAPSFQPEQDVNQEPIDFEKIPE